MKYPALSGQYVLDRTIGCGGFAKVKLATHTLTGEKVAIKIMQKQTLMEDLPRVKHEISALKSLAHPNICKLYQVIETSTHYFLVMEYCNGGELLDHIVEKERLNEDEARVFFGQVVSAVAYMHDEGFAHRDLKPENILLDRDKNLKLIDFGLSLRPEKGLKSHLYTSCGSPNYAAPELIKGEEYLGCEIDVWSLGVLLYALLCGSLPFDDTSIQKLYEKIMFGQYEEKEWLSKESKMLLQSLLQVNARKRITTEQLRIHPWLRKGVHQSARERRGHKFLVRDEQCLMVLSNHLRRTPDDLWKELSRKNYDYNMATYLLLMEKKRTYRRVSLVTVPLITKQITVLDDNTQTAQTQSSNLIKSPANLRTRPPTTPHRDESLAPRQTDENRMSGRKRIRSPGIPSDKTESTEAKRLKKAKTPTPASGRANRFIASTPRSTKKILEGIEKGFNMARNALTPRRTQTEDKRPTTLWGKDLCNVSSTTSTSPQEVLQQLQQALTSKGIICTIKGYTLRGKLKQQQNNKGKEEDHKLSFELEVCWLPGPSDTRTSNTSDPPKNAVVGIRRKRLRGDAWIYKNICEEVLALTAC